MKNYLLGWQDWETEFEGDKISMQLCPLSRSEFLKILPELDDFYKSTKVGDESGLSTAIIMSAALDRIEPIIASHVRDFKGFTVNGKAPDTKEVLSASMFMTLVSNIVFRLVEISKISSGEEKNSGGQSTSETSAA